jgi:uncharacterized membrane protein
VSAPREAAREASAGAPGGVTDLAVEQVIGRLLQIGVLLAAAVVAVGGAMLLFQYGRAPAQFAVFRGEPPELRSVGAILRGVAARDSRAVVQLGLVLLVATPVARVALTLAAFVVQRDRMYIAITALVLALLLYSLVWGQV